MTKEVWNQPQNYSPKVWGALGKTLLENGKHEQGAFWLYASRMQQKSLNPALEPTDFYPQVVLPLLMGVNQLPKDPSKEDIKTQRDSLRKTLLQSEKWVRQFPIPQGTNKADFDALREDQLVQDDFQIQAFYKALLQTHHPLETFPTEPPPVPLP